ncbi:RHS repeat-associated core domain-containing protein [Flavobacterium sp. WV_118_3]|uniref:RHS repeat-associated core domain-containing protein n=1 Tax=Flavobacterium sp. WV_118_3 TaxID=3151764 RepID=UPI00321950E5
MLVPNRHEASNEYRYSFNGKEKDDEIKGEGNHYDYGMRNNDPRSGRFFSVDPLTKSYPALTPYQFASNTPIMAIDLDGMEAKVVTYGVKNTYDDNYVKDCSDACASKLGLEPKGVSTGKNLLRVLKDESSGSNETISAWVNYGHSWNRGLFLTNDNGFYRANNTAPGAGADNFKGLLRETKTGNITFSKHTLFIFASCGTAGNGWGGHNVGGGKAAYDNASFSATIGDYVNKNYSLPARDYTGFYKITTIGATDLSNLLKDGTVKTDGRFFKTEKVYKIERTVQESGWWPFKTRKYIDKTTIIQTKTTDLGKKINPTELMKEHNDQDTKIR